MRFSLSGPSARRRILLAALGFLVLIAVAVAGGMQIRVRLAPPAAAAPEARPRIGVVDLDAVVRAHPRWREFDALNKRASRLEIQLLQVPIPPPPPRADLQRALNLEAGRLRAGFEKELEFLRQESHRRLEAFSATVREEQQAQFETGRNQLESEGRAALEAQQRTLQAQFKAAEQEIMTEYTYPLLNLRLRAEVAGLSSEQEGRAVLREIQALQQEREERIKTKGEEFDKQFQEFQKAKEAEVNTKIEALKESLNKEAQERLAAKQHELEAELNRMAAEKEQQFRMRLEQRQKELIAAAEAQLRTQQRAYLSGLDERARQVRAELRAVQEQRARLEVSVLAEVKITVATIAQAEKLDVVLTRYVANVAGVNITPAVVQRFKR